jgi:hypothetical protein
MQNKNIIYDTDTNNLIIDINNVNNENRLNKNIESTNEKNIEKNNESPPSKSETIIKFHLNEIEKEKKYPLREINVSKLVKKSPNTKAELLIQKIYSNRKNVMKHTHSSFSSYSDDGQYDKSESISLKKEINGYNQLYHSPSYTSSNVINHSIPTSYITNCTPIYKNSSESNSDKFYDISQTKNLNTNILDNEDNIQNSYNNVKSEINKDFSDSEKESLNSKSVSNLSTISNETPSENYTINSKIYKESTSESPSESLYKKNEDVSSDTTPESKNKNISIDKKKNDNRNEKMNRKYYKNILKQLKLNDKNDKNKYYGQIKPINILPEYQNEYQNEQMYQDYQNSLQNISRNITPVISPNISRNVTPNVSPRVVNQYNQFTQYEKESVPEQLWNDSVEKYYLQFQQVCKEEAIRYKNLSRKHENISKILKFVLLISGCFTFTLSITTPDTILLGATTTISSCLTAIITSINGFFKYDKICEIEYYTYKELDKLYNTISVELLKPPNMRNDPYEFILSIQNRRDELLNLLHDKK